MLSENKESFPSSTTIWMTLISFPCLAPLAGISSTIMNKSGESKHSLRESIQSFISKYDNSFRFFIFSFYQVKSVPFYF